MNTRLCLLCLAFFVFAGCGSEKTGSKLSFFTTVESSYAWQDNLTPSITWSNDAHSGNYVCKIDSATPYSLTFNMRLSDISGKKLKSVRVKAWVNMSSMVSNPLVGFDFQDSTGKSMEWFSRPVKDFVAGPNQWEEADVVVNMNEKDRNRRSNILRLYIMNDHRDFTQVDDIEVSFEEL